MILEHLQGTCLGDVYDDMPGHMKKSIVRSLVCLLKQFSEVTFDAIGTLLSASPDSFGIKIGHAVKIVNVTHLEHAPPPLPARARSILKNDGLFLWQRSSEGIQVIRSTYDSHQLSALLWISCPSQIRIHQLVLCCIIQT
jgi:hypothetical protein